MSSFAIYLDANWIDAGAILGALIFAAYRWKKADPSRRFLHTRTGYDFANGAALFPLFVLALSVFSSWLVKELMSASRVTLSVAGVVALLALLEDEQ